MTISNVVNCKGRVSAETRERVRKAIEALGYRPNAAARGLAGGKPIKVGISTTTWIPSSSRRHWQVRQLPLQRMMSNCCFVPSRAIYPKRSSCVPRA